jgi:hypothetical protein
VAFDSTRNADLIEIARSEPKKMVAGSCRQIGFGTFDALDELQTGHEPLAQFPDLLRGVCGSRMPSSSRGSILGEKLEASRELSAGSALSLYVEQFCQNRASIQRFPCVRVIFWRKQIPRFVGNTSS